MGAADEAGERVLVLDTSALIMGLDPSALRLPVYTAPSVGDELIPDTPPFMRYSMSQATGSLIVKEPGESAMKAVREASDQAGDSGVLSKADVEVLGLAFELKKAGLMPTIVSDDYAIQNISEVLVVEHASLATFGITRKFDWIYYCPACFRKYPPESVERVCRVCGTGLKRKVVRQERASTRKNRTGLRA